MAKFDFSKLKKTLKASAEDAKIAAEKVQESVKESLHAASWATQTCEGVEDAFRCKSRFCRVDPVKEYQYDDHRQADK